MNARTKPLGVITRRVTKLSAGLVIVTSLATACDASSTATSGDGVVTVVTDLLPASLDPTEPGGLSAAPLRMLGAAEALAKIQADGSVEPELAETIEQTAPTQWIVQLRPDARFWSGKPVTAQDVIASLNRSKELEASAQSALEGISMAAVDPSTVRFDTRSPDPWFAYTLARYALVIYNADSYPDKTGSIPVEAADMTGPFRVTSFAPGRDIALERHPDWWGEATEIERIEGREIADPQSRAQIALAGQADIVAAVPAQRAAEIDESPTMGIVAEPAANTVAVYLNPNSSKAPALADPRVRRALAWAVDRDEVVEIAGDGLAVPASSWLASNPAYPEADEQGFTRYDPKLAGELLDQAGWLMDEQSEKRMKDGEPLEFRLLTWGEEESTGVVLQDQWARIGVTVALRNVDDSLIIQAREADDWDAFTEAWGTLGDVPGQLESQIGADGSANYAQLTLPQVPNLLERGTISPTEQSRTDAVLELNELLVEQVPSIPVHPRVEVTAVTDSLSGFIGHPLQYENIVQPGMTDG